jgi:hypothetical protein
MPFSRMPGIADPEELEALQSVFEEACRLSHVGRGSSQANVVALKIMLLHQSGVEDRKQLLEAAIKLSDTDKDQDQGDLRCG